MLKSKDYISAKDAIRFVNFLKKYEQKPVWRFTKEFPFIKRFYIFPIGKKFSGKEIDNIIRKTLGER